MKNPTPWLTLAAALVACGGAPEPAAETPTAEAPASAPADPSDHDGHAMHHAHHHGHHHHGFEDPAQWAEKWDTSERDAWQKPEAVMAVIAPKPTDRVADIGAGTGYFAARLARRAPEGVVYAVDLEPAMVEWLGKRAAQEQLANLTAVQATPDDAKLPAPVDLVMLTNTYHHIEGRTPYFTRLRAHLRPGGRVAIVDYKQQFEGHGPPPAMRLAPDTVVREMQAAGYTLAQRDEELLPRQYIVVFTAAE